MAGRASLVLAVAGRVALAAGLIVVIGAAPAGAHPVAPTEYRSEVVALEPPTDAVRLEVVGGDAFLRVRVRPGHTATVLGYQDEPYYRIDPDGSIYVNTRSPAHYLNSERYAEAELPAHADPEAEPEWRRLGGGGEVSWHDHRIHWMIPGRPPPVQDDTGLVRTWEVALVVDGERVVATGSLWLESSPNPLPPLAAAAVVALGAAVLGRKRRWAIPAGAGVATLAALWLGWSQLSAAPEGVSLTITAVALVLLPALGAVAALVAAGLWVSRRAEAAEIAALGVCVTLAFWALPRLDVLVKPVLPSTIPASVDRVVFAGVLALAATTAVLALTRGLSTSHAGAVAAAPPPPAAPPAAPEPRPGPAVTQGRR